MEQTLEKEYGNIDQTGQEFLTFSNEIIRNVQKIISILQKKVHRTHCALNTNRMYLRQ